MIHLRDRQSLGPQISHFSPFVFQTVLLLLTHFCVGQSQKVDQPQPIVAMLGDDITLPCHLEPAVDAVSMTVEWARADLTPRFVHLRREGVELLIQQNPSYIRRTSLSVNKLKCGDLSLKLSKVKLSDEGTYTCLTASQGRQETQAVVKLVVGSVFSPVLKLSRLSGESTAVLLDSESKGWYPEPEVSWLDSEGHVLSAGPTKKVRGPDGLYTVSSRVTVEKRHSDSFTCRVQQKDTNQTRETQIYVPDDLFGVPSYSVRIVIIVVVGFMFILAVALIFSLSACNKNKTKMDRGDGTELIERGETTGPTESELQYVEDAIETLKEQKEGLKHQKEHLIPLQEKVKTQIAKKLKPPNDGKERQKKYQYLKDSVDEHERLIKKTDKLLETTEEMINRMTERKGQLQERRERSA